MKNEQSSQITAEFSVKRNSFWNLAFETSDDNQIPVDMTASVDANQMDVSPVGYQASPNWNNVGNHWQFLCLFQFSFIIKNVFDSYLRKVQEDGPIHYLCFFFFAKGKKLRDKKALEVQLQRYIQEIINMNIDINININTVVSLFCSLCCSQGI